MSPDFFKNYPYFAKNYRSVAFFGGKIYSKCINLLDKKGGGGKIG